MTETRVPPEIMSYLARFIDSVETIEILMLLSDGGARTWSAEQVNEQLRSSLSSITTRLSTLQSAGLLENTESGYRFQPQSPELTQQTKSFLDYYRTHRFGVTELVYSKAVAEIRGFSDAFKLGGGKKEDG